MTALPPAITTENLKLWYGSFQALKGITCRIPEGKITSLIGPSGCGKTTLLRCFNRINERYDNVRTEGTITILGKNIYDADVSLYDLRKAVGMVFQRPNPMPISVYDNVAFGLNIHKSDSSKAVNAEQLVEQSLKSVGLWEDLKDSLDKKATELQLEQQQKLCIARLLPLEPEVILMDEPCSALDVAGTSAIEELMQELKQRFTILIVTHNMAQARRVSEECIFMLTGEMVEHGLTSEIFLQPKDPRTLAYVEGRYG